MELSGRQ